MALIQNEYFDIVHNSLLSWLNNEIAVCAFMGNFYAESKITPNRRQGDNTIPIGQSSIKYTADVDSGRKTEHQFVHDSVGYGLAQWTYYSRKQKLYDIESLSTSSIGNIYRQLKMVKLEITGNRDALRYLQSVQDLHEASDWICKNYERPAINNLADRRRYTDEIYEIYNSTPSDEHRVNIIIYGNGEARAVPTSGQEGTHVQIFADALGSDTFERWSIVSGIDSLELPLDVAYNELIIGNENVTLLCYFSGEEPEPQPIPKYNTFVELPQKHMPIWFYTLFKFW